MNEQREYPFAFSVVMAVYNVEPFLREAVDSLIAQDFGFERIQLIMVDDGSTDGSGAVCDEYAAQYPENVLVIHKENGGVSSARNEGLNYIKGRFVSFMDADDKFSENMLTTVYSFFCAHEEETDVVSAPIYFFDGKDGPHVLNYKFKSGTRIINLLEEYSAIQLSMASAFFRHDAVQCVRLDERLSFDEDSKYLSFILLNKCTLGVVDNVKYLYRRRVEGPISAVQTSNYSEKWYLPCLRYFHAEIISYCMNKFGYIPKFIQFTMAYDLQWKVKANIPEGILSSEEKQLFREELEEILKFIDDDVILEQKHVFPEHKVFMLKKKHEGTPYIIKNGSDALLCFGRTAAVSLAHCKLCFEFLSVEKDCCTLEGYIVSLCFPYKTMQLYAQVNGENFLCEQIVRKQKDYALEEEISNRVGFRVSVPLSYAKEAYHIRFFVVIDDTKIFCKNFSFGQFAPVCNQYRNAYYYKDRWKVSATKDRVFITACGRKGRLKSELAFCKELWKKNAPGGRKAVFARLAYHIFRCFKHKPIWLISDRIIKAGDNGEAFFRFVRSTHKSDVKAYFILSKDSVDYQAVRKIGPVIDALSFRHKLLHLLCDYNISAHADTVTVNPFHGYHDGYRDILSGIGFFYLQHGIIKDDISGWLNRYNQNACGFITASPLEYQSILDGNYYYTDKQLCLTGFPRFDRLYRNEKKYITIMPTWRKNLMQNFDPKTGIRSLDLAFEKSDFFIFYHSLLCHPKLLSAAKQLGYTICFLPHPTLQPHLSIFGQIESVHILGLDASYRDLFAQSDLVITDYSSAVFDFAYLYKPIVYCQFDSKEFYAGHLYTEGYFSYERDGFGEVEYDLEGTVDRIIEYMENGCQLKDKYRERIDKFFAFNDQNNCQRVYEEIIKLDKQD